jgi:hypothetical protein
VTDAPILFSTNCNHYQPRWLHIAAQTHDPKNPIPMDDVKALLEKAATRFRWWGVGFEWRRRLPFDHLRFQRLSSEGPFYFHNFRMQL